MIGNQHPSYFFSETYCGGYSGEDPPLPIPNREVKLTIADGTAPPGGRVGSCHFLIRDPDITRCRGLLFYPGAELFSFVAACFSTPVSYADSPFQVHADRSLRSGQASPLLQCSSNISLTRMTPSWCASSLMSVSFVLFLARYLFQYGKYAGWALKVMQAVLRFSSKRPFLVPLARVLTKSSVSSTEIPVKMLISPTAYTSFCCFECKRSSVAMLSDPQYQTQSKA